MFKEKLKKLPSRIFYILFALVVSFALWLYVEITVNEEQTFEVHNIPIHFSNEDVLRDRGLIPSVLTENISLNLRASRADMNRLATPGALSVMVNLANVPRTGAVQLDYDIIWPHGVNPNAVDILGRSATLITLLIDREHEISIPVNGTYTGGTASPELIAEPAEFEPQFITVRGPWEVLSRIDSAYVPILRENLSSTFTEDLEFLIIDDYGEHLDDNILDSLDLSHYTVRVTVSIREMREVPLTVTLFHGATTTDLNTMWSANPTHVTLSADPDVIRDINSITLRTVDMTSFGTSSTLELPILIPGGVENISGETTATVYIEVLGLDIAYRNTSIIYYINTPPGFTAEILTREVLVALRGESEDLALVNSENIRVVADIGELGPGVTPVVARIYIDGIEANIDPVGEYRVTVRLDPE